MEIRTYENKTGNNINSSENQRIIGQFVAREVVQNVSMLIHHFAGGPETMQGSDYHYDDVLDLCQKDDWQDAAEDEGFSVGEERNIVDRDGRETIYDDWQELCEDEDIEPYTKEALEHWIVSDFLYRKLKEKEEMAGELFGLKIWGRTTSGQAILLDRVIAEIACEMEILVGQRYEWKI